jgi:hypothetical protein
MVSGEREREREREREEERKKERLGDTIPIKGILPMP